MIFPQNAFQVSIWDEVMAISENKLMYNYGFVCF